MGSFLLPNDPASKSAPPFGGSFAGSAAATPGSAVKTSAAASGRARAGAPALPRPRPRAPRRSGRPPEAAGARGPADVAPAPPPAPSRSRRLDIALYRGVDVLEQPHVLRADLALGAAAAHVERAPVDGHVARRGDQILRPVVGRLRGLELHIVELDRHAAAQRDRLHLVAVETDAALSALPVRLAALLLHEERHPRLEDHDLVLLLEELRISRRDLPHHPAVLHLGPTKILQALDDLGQATPAELPERSSCSGQHRGARQVP